MTSVLMPSAPLVSGQLREGVYAPEHLVERVSGDFDDEFGALRVVTLGDRRVTVPEQVACDLDASRFRYRRSDSLAETAEGEMLGVYPDSQHLRIELTAEHPQQFAQRAWIPLATSSRKMTHLPVPPARLDHTDDRARS